MIQLTVLPLLLFVLGMGAEVLTPPAGATPAKAMTQSSLNSTAVEEAALRERLRLFYDCYLNGAFRQAEQYVAMDSRDTFFNASKERIRGYKILRTDFLGDGKSAKVMLVINTEFSFGGRSAAVDMPLTASWKLVDGAWYWSSPSVGNQTGSFGFTPSQAPLDKSLRNSAPAVAVALLDKPVLTLTEGDHGSDETHLMNPSSKLMKFHIEASNNAGIVVKPTSGEIPPGTSVVIQASLAGKRYSISTSSQIPAYIVIEHGVRLQFYVDIQRTGNAAGSN